MINLSYIIFITHSVKCQVINYSKRMWFRKTKQKKLFKTQLDLNDREKFSKEYTYFL